MPDVVFLYTGNDYSLVREVVCRKLIVATSTIIPLPADIQVRFANLGSVYGHTRLEFRFRNRLSLHSALTISEAPGVLVHELIHLSQSHLGVLRTTNHGQYFWKDKQYDLAVTPYQNLPWEIDVQERHEKVMTEALAVALKLG